MRLGLAVAGVVALAGCGDPLRDVDRLSDAGLADAGAANITVDPEAEAQTPGGAGFLGRLFGVGAAPDTGATSDATDVTDIAAVPPDAVPDSDAGQGGEDGTITLAAAAAQPEPEAERPAGTGLFGRLREARAETGPRLPTGPDAMRILPGMAVPYGAIGTNCDVSRRDRGSRVARQSGFEVWDTAPGTTAPRTHYITGFSDDCARQFTGALVLMGDVGTHELVRYSDVNIDQPWSEVDNAYEEVKGRVCRVARRQPCGARLETLGSDTAFVTVYESFGSGPEWVEILLHDGEVLAIARERP